MSAPAEMASMNALVPDFAIVPRFVIRSDLVMPIPVSRMVSVLLILSAMRSILSCGSDSSAEASVSAV